MEKDVAAPTGSLTSFVGVTFLDATVIKMATECVGTNGCGIGSFSNPAQKDVGAATNQLARFQRFFDIFSFLIIKYVYIVQK